MFKKKFVAASALALMIGIGHGSAGAMENSTTNFEDVNTVVEPTLKEGGISYSEEVLPEIIPFAYFGISSSSLKSNTYTKSASSFYFKKGETVKLNSATWTPVGQKIKIGFVHATNGSQYWTTSTFAGGTLSSRNISMDGPSGEYYVAILAVNTNTTNINVSGSFDF